MNKVRQNGRIDLFKELEKLNHLKELDLSSQVITDYEEIEYLNKILLGSKSIHTVKLPRIALSSDNETN